VSFSFFKQFILQNVHILLHLLKDLKKLSHSEKTIQTQIDYFHRLTICSYSQYSLFLFFTPDFKFFVKVWKIKNKINVLLFILKASDVLRNRKFQHYFCQNKKKTKYTIFFSTSCTNRRSTEVTDFYFRFKLLKTILMKTSNKKKKSAEYCK
jgi:hypothetical protein